MQSIDDTSYAGHDCPMRKPAFCQRKYRVDQQKQCDGHRSSIPRPSDHLKWGNRSCDESEKSSSLLIAGNTTRNNTETFPCRSGPGVDVSIFISLENERSRFRVGSHRLPSVVYCARDESGQISSTPGHLFSSPYCRRCSRAGACRDPSQLQLLVSWRAHLSGRDIPVGIVDNPEGCLSPVVSG